MPTDSLAALEYAHANRARFLSELEDILTIPSVSTDPAHTADIERAANWMAGHLRGLGAANVQVIPTARHPVVYGELLQAGPAAPTVLVYGHYDVQPPDPLDLWESPPFAPTVRGEYLFARGASDMKGQVMATLDAVEALIKTGALRVNLKFIIEGEEEVGSPNLAAFIDDHRALLAADFSLNPDAGGVIDNHPTIGYALRGLAYFELRLYGPARDLHSGAFGGIVHNPAQVLCDLVAGMHDADGRVTVPGFYDRVRPLDDAERAELARLPFGEAFYREQAGVSDLWGEKGYSAVERIGARPTLEVNGLLSGFTGKGSKTVLPAHAMAKLSMRLVPDQTPAEVHAGLRQYLAAHAPPTVRWELDVLATGDGIVTDRSLPEVQAMREALTTVWQSEPIFVRGGGSVPVVAQLHQALGLDSILTGFSSPTDRIHSPNENLHLPTWYKGIDALIHFFCNLQPD